MAALPSELTVTVSADFSAFTEALEAAQDAVLAVLRRQYLAEGSPNGATPEGFGAWLAEKDALLAPAIEFEPLDFVPKKPATGYSLEKFKARLDQMRKGPPGSEDEE